MSSWKSLKRLWQQVGADALECRRGMLAAFRKTFGIGRIRKCQWNLMPSLILTDNCSLSGKWPAWLVCHNQRGPVDLTE